MEYADLVATGDVRHEFQNDIVELSNPVYWLSGTDATMNRLLIVIIVLLLSACANMTPSQAPEWRQTGAHDFGATRLAFAPSMDVLASGGFQGEIRLWSLPDGKVVSQHRAHTGTVRGLFFDAPDRLVSAGEDGRLVLWQTTGWQAVVEKQGPAVSSLMGEQGSSVIITGHADGAVRLWSRDGLKEQGLLRLDSPVLAVAQDKTGTRFAVSSENDDVLVLDKHLKILQRLDAGDRNALSLRFSPDGNTLAAGTWFKLVEWDLATGQRKILATEHLGAIIAIDYSPDGKRLISLGRHTDANLRLVNSETGTVQRRLAAHGLCGWYVRFSPDGRYIASASEDESIRLYDVDKPYQPQWQQE